MKEKIIPATILALGIVILGLCLKSGIDNFVNKDRQVTVKGLSEQDVEADRVTWPIVSKEIGNDLPELYSKIAQKEQTIKNFLLKNGVKEEEITINPPRVIDMNANEYSEQNKRYRYNITSIITVVSSNVKVVRGIIARQGELLKDGIAILENGYENSISYEFVDFPAMKPKMMQEAIANAQKTAEQFAVNSNSKINKIIKADQGQFSIENRDSNTPHIKRVRVVTTVTYSLKN